MNRPPAFAIALLLVSAPGPAEPGERAAIVEGVYADNGDVHIRYRNGTTVAAPKGNEDKSLSEPALAADGRTVGWLANFDNCCQSYPIPQQLVIWRSYRVIRRIDASAMIWRWRFYDDGRKVGFSDGPTHGSHVPYSYKLYDVATGQLIREIAGNSKISPEWAVLLLSPPGMQGQKE
jgi:hypothetical protein